MGEIERERERERNLICGFCYYWEDLPGDRTFEGFCTRYPPRVFYHNSVQGRDRPETLYPLVETDDRCGEWRHFKTFLRIEDLYINEVPE